MGKIIFISFMFWMIVGFIVGYLDYKHTNKHKQNENK